MKNRDFGETTLEKITEISEEMENDANENKRTSEKKVKTSEKIIALLRADSSMSAADIGLRLGRTPCAVEMQLQKLKNKNLLCYVGPEKGGHWEVID